MTKMLSFKVMMSPFHFIRLEGLFFIFILIRIYTLFDVFKIFVINKNIFTLIVMNIFIINTFSLIPFMFCLSRYLWNRLLLSLCLIFTIITYRCYKNLNKYLSHLLPRNSPVLLWDILIILELLSNLIRPLTLSLRLTCNILTGHVLIRLIFETTCLVVIFLLIFELGVRVIQSQVFSILFFSYSH